MNAISSARIVDLDSEGLVKNHARSTDALHAGRHSEALALSRLSAVLQTSIELSEII